MPVLTPNFAYAAYDSDPRAFTAPTILRRFKTCFDLQLAVMPTFTPAQAARHFREAATSLPAAVIRDEQETVKEAKAKAVQMSSGPHSTAALRAAGHPYGRRTRNVNYEAAIINAQSGRFRAAWATTAPRLTGGAVICSVVNGSPEAKFMAGTKNMVARPIADAVKAAIHPRRRQRLILTIKQILSP